MRNFTVYSKSTGEVLRSGKCNEEEFDAQVVEADEAVLPISVDDSDYYVNLATNRKNIRPRPNVKASYQIAIDSGIVRFSVPKGTTVTFAEQSYIIDDGIVELSHTVAGDFFLVVTPPFPWVEVESKVIVS